LCKGDDISRSVGVDADDLAASFGLATAAPLVSSIVKWN